jgi:hypothetical protein
MTKFHVVQAPEPLSYLSVFEGNGSLGRGWSRDAADAHSFEDRVHAERVAVGVRSTYTAVGGHRIEVRAVPELQP